MSKGNEVALSIRTAVLNPAYKYVTGIFVKRRDALPSRGAVWKQICFLRIPKHIRFVI